MLAALVLATDAALLRRRPSLRLLFGLLCVLQGWVRGRSQAAARQGSMSYKCGLKLAGR